MTRPPRVLAIRSDGRGDVLLCEPALRSVAAQASHLTLLCGPEGESVAGLLAAVDHILVHDCPWIAADPPPVRRTDFARLLDDLARVEADVAIVFTSERQSALPMALALRLAGVPRIIAHSEHYPGSLLDVRVRPQTGSGSTLPHEVQRNIALIEAGGFDGPADRAMQVRLPDLGPEVEARLPPRYVVVHAGSSVSARSMGHERWLPVVDALLAGWPAARGSRAGSGPTGSSQVVLTGSVEDDNATSLVAALRDRPGVVDLVGATSFGELGAVIDRAEAICVGNTGALHLASAVGTPVVACFPPTVPAERWGPWSVPAIVLGNPTPCAPCYLRECPLEGHPCADIDPSRVASAVRILSPTHDRDERPRSMAEGVPS